MSDTIQSADAFGSQVVKLAGIGILGDKEKAIESSNAIGALIRSRDAAIRADEARKQAERYAAVVESVKVYLQEHSCSNSQGTCQDETNLRKALADLEAPK
jgi:hypothetical protein